MIKFIYARAEEPMEPSWDCQNRIWRNPEQFETPHNLTLMWSHIWDWMCGKKNRYKSFRASNADPMNGVLDPLNADDLNTRISAMHSIASSFDLSAIPTLISKLNSDLQWERLTAIYTLGALGEPAVDPLLTALKNSAHGEANDPTNEIWNENSILMEDASFALAYANAQDDFFNIQEAVLKARGKYSSIYGPGPNKINAIFDYMVGLLLYLN